MESGKQKLYFLRFQRLLKKLHAEYIFKSKDYSINRGLNYKSHKLFLEKEKKPYILKFYLHHSTCLKIYPTLVDSIRKTGNLFWAIN